MLDYILPIAACAYALLQLFKDWEKHQTTWRRVAVFALVLLMGAGTAVNNYMSKRKSATQHSADQAKIAQLQSAIESANQNQKLVQQKLAESLQREQRLNDQNNDLRTSIDAQNELLQIVKHSLPLPLQKQADAIHKNWRREVVQSVNVDAVASH